MTHIEQIKARNKAYTRILFRLTDLTMEEYVTMQMDIAYQYLLEILEGDKVLINCIYKDALFWRWFVNNWQNRDANGFISSLYKVDKQFRLSKYKAMHFSWCVARYQQPQMPQLIMDKWYKANITQMV